MAGLPGGRLLLPPPQLCLLRQAGSPEGQEKEEEEEVAGASSSGRRRTDQEAEHLHPAQQVRSVLPDGVNGHKVSALVAFIYYIYKKEDARDLKFYLLYPNYQLQKWMPKTVLVQKFL